VQIDSQDQLQADILRSKRLGFQAKLCIHPTQVDAVILGFQPSAQEIAYAQAVVAADRTANGGVVQLNGKMVDRPVVMLAKSVLQQVVLNQRAP
jgi:citrate lyase subunit beta/citryl-CoA lyase